MGPVELGWRHYLVWEPKRPTLPLPLQVRLEREGTAVQLSSQELGRAELLEVARSLVPAPDPSLRRLTQPRSGTRRFHRLPSGS